MDLPTENQRLKKVIDYTCNGNVLKFSNEIGVSQPRISRLFAVDNRNGKYPLISFDILQATINKFIEINSEWLINGKGEMLKMNDIEDKVKAKEKDREVPVLQKQIIELQNHRILQLEEEITQLKKELKHNNGYRNVAEPD